MKKANFPRVDRSMCRAIKDSEKNVRPYSRVISLGVLWAIMLLFGALSTVAQTRYYVNAASSAQTPDGSTWATAFTDLQAALAVAQDGSEIWVAEGVYRPAAAGVRTVAFELKNGVAIYGGFAGVESTLAARDWKNNLTILSGDIDWADAANGRDGAEVVTDPATQIKGANSHTVVLASGVDNTAILDGFVITGGSADEGTGANGITSSGAGIFNNNASPTLRNLDITGNKCNTRGAGLNNMGTSNPILTDVRIRNNHAPNTTTGQGGGIFTSASITLTNAEISNNSAGYGGGLHTFGAVKVTLVNVLIYSNAATYAIGAGGTGGGIRADGADELILTNVTISGNRAPLGGGLRNQTRGTSGVHAKPIINNSIIWGNTDLDGNESSTSNVSNQVTSGQPPQNGINLEGSNSSNNLIKDNDGNSNITLTPPLSIADLTIGMLFENPTAGNYRLKEESPALDVGDNSKNTTEWDLDGKPRTVGTIDLGPYEYTSASTVSSNIRYVKKGESGDGSAWNNAFGELSAALTWARDNWDATTDGSLQIWVAEGVYKPTTTNSDARTATFQLMSGVEVYGGFAGTETSLLDDRTDWKANPTILSGDIDNNDNVSATNGIVLDPGNQIDGFNSYNVVTSSGVDNSAILDGFIITGGSADTPLPNPIPNGAYAVRDRSGGGIYNNSSGSPTLRNLDIVGNQVISRGGGLYNNNGHPVLTDVRIRNNRTDNSSSGNGGGIYNLGTITITNSEIINNKAGYGGGLHVWSGSNSTLTNVLIHGNGTTHGSGSGGGIRNARTGLTGLTLTNVTITGNTASGSSGGGLSNEYHATPGGSRPTVVNSIIWGNANGDVYNQNVNDGINIDNNNSNNNLIGNNDGGSNIDGDFTSLTVADIFTDHNNGDYTLNVTNPDNPAINGGNGVLYLGLDVNTTDLAGNPRVYDFANGGVIDLGPYEYQGSGGTGPVSNILYVNANVAGSGNGSGSSWNNALPQLSEALNWARDNWDVAADGPLQIWVAKGVYKPTTTDPDARNAAFELIKGVEVYGGFAGTETSLDDRTDWKGNPTVLSGDIDNNDTPDPNGIITDPATQISGNNSYNVVLASDADNTTILNGFTITGGNANIGTDNTSTSLRNSNGGGIYSSEGSPHLSNLNIVGNQCNLRGAGIFITAASSETMLIDKVKISNNRGIFPSTNTFGGGIFTSASKVAIENSEISNNSSSYGGGLQIWEGTNNNTILTNVLIHGNSATWTSGAGGGMRIRQGATVTLTNVTITGNKASSAATGPGISMSAATLITINNSIVLGNVDADDVVVANSIQGSIAITNTGINSGNNLIQGENGNSNIADIPTDLMVNDIFENPSNGNYGLKEDSFAIDKGNNSKNTTALDLAGNPRIYNITNGGIIDLGAYEYQDDDGGTPPQSSVLYVKHDASGSGNGSDWTNAYRRLQDAISAATAGTQIWVAEGVYKPTTSTTDRNATFTLKSGVEIYGGFAGGETVLDERDWTSKFTILSGDVDNNDDPDPNAPNGVVINPAAQIKGGNSYTVVTTSSDVNNTAILDGFVITGGSADNASQSDVAHPSRTGGGIHNSGGSPVLRNLDISGNQSWGHGAGIYISGGDTKLTGSKVRNNRGMNTDPAANFGGGIYNTLGKLTVLNAEISNNSSGYGGGFQDWGGAQTQTTMTNVLIYGNSASGNHGGGGIRGRTACMLTLTNVTITGNRAAGNGPGIGVNGSIITVNNSIIWGNLDADGAPVANSISSGVATGSTNNLIETTLSNVGNIPHNPLGLSVDDIFVAPADGDYAPRPGSPVIDQGSNSKLWEALQQAGGHSNPMPTDPADAAWGTDLAGEARILENTVDLGAYEGLPSTAPILRVFWNGNAVPSSGLDLAYGDQGTLTVTTTGDAVPTIVSDPLLSLSASTSPAEATALTLGTGQLTVTSAATDDLEEAILVLEVRISPKVVTVTADAVSKEVGQIDPLLTYTVEGLLSNDQPEDILTGALTRQAGESKGTYPIEQGTLSIAAGNDHYTLAFVSADFRITGLLQQITLTAPYEQMEIAVGTVPLTAIASSGLPVTLTVDDPTVAAISGNILTLLKPGTVTITATQEGNDTYEPAAPVSITITVIENYIHVNKGVSPDGNGINDFLRIDRIEGFPDNVVTIFDRTGKVIDEIFGYENNQRIFTGENLRSGTYFYRIDVTVHGGERRTYKGSFELKSRD